MNIIKDIGLYSMLMYRVFTKPDRGRMFWKQLPKELEKLGLASLPIVIIISVFIGAIMTIQTKLNTENPFLFNTSVALDRLCTGHSLKGYQYFMFQKAYREDMDQTFKKSKSGITFSNMDHIVGQDQDKICDMKI